MNRSALNRACVTIWKNASLGICIPILIIINPNWLRVDKAIIFFMSHSEMALSPAINIVDVPMIRSDLLKILIDSRNG